MEILLGILGLAAAVYFGVRQLRQNQPAITVEVLDDELQILRVVESKGPLRREFYQSKITVSSVNGWWIGDLPVEAETGKNDWLYKSVDRLVKKELLKLEGRAPSAGLTPEGRAVLAANRRRKVKEEKVLGAFEIGPESR